MHAAVHLFSNRSHMMSKCGKNKSKRVHRAIAKCVTGVPDATSNKRETNVSLTSRQTLIEEKRLPRTKAKRTYETKIKKFNKFIYCKHNTDL